jgi:hypothetical protein
METRNFAQKPKNLSSELSDSPYVPTEMFLRQAVARLLQLGVRLGDTKITSRPYEKKSAKLLFFRTIAEE